MLPRTSAGQRAHWRTPTVIILAFLAGLGFAIGHHCFYASLDGESVDEHRFSQQFNTSVGTAFAFLVRASLVIAVGAVYWQLFWERVAHKTFAVSHIDSLAGALGSIFDLLDFRAIRSGPVLGILALLSWLVPFSAILPPATLSVQSSVTSNITQARVPRPVFANDAMAIWSRGSNMATSNPQLQFGNYVYYQNPALQLSRFATVTAFRGQVSDFLATYANSTYVLNFAAPAVQCKQHSPDILRAFNTASRCNRLFGRNDTTAPWNACEDLWGYVSWAPNATSLVPFEAGSVRNGSLRIESLPTFKFGVNYRSPYYGGYQQDPVAFFVATRKMWSKPAPDTWEVLNCSLFNASYTVNMTSDASRRVVPSLTDVQMLHSVSDHTFSHKEGQTETVMSIFPSEADRVRFSYMALMDSMGRLFSGTIFMKGADSVDDEDFRYYNGGNIIDHTRELLRTKLLWTTQLLPFTGRTFVVADDAPPIDAEQWTVLGNITRNAAINFTAAYPAFAADEPLFNHSLGSAIEQLFQNISMSLFSEPAFLEQTDSDVSITVRRTQNIFSYDRRNLLLSYGLALGLSLLACAVGCFSVLRGNVSYSNRFSTVLRTTRGADLETLVAPKDRSGADPLPEHLAKARVALGESRAFEGSDEGSAIELQHGTGQKPADTSERSGMAESGEDDETSYLQPEVYRRRSSSGLGERKISRASQHECSGSDDWS